MKKGFTLFELLIVLAIMSVISFIFVPQALKIQKESVLRELDDTAMLIYLQKQNELTSVYEASALKTVYLKNSVYLKDDIYYVKDDKCIILYSPNRGKVLGVYYWKDDFVYDISGDELLVSFEDRLKKDVLIGYYQCY